MPKKSLKNRRDLEKLTRVNATIINEASEIGVYHFNKLTYLFEYFFIKNFGARYTKEPFIKLPHGPVICDYKKQIKHLHQNSLLHVDIDKLMKNRMLQDDDYDYKRVIISRTNHTTEMSIMVSSVLNLIRAVVDRFAKLSVHQLEKFVYSTVPVKNYQTSFYFKKPIGGYVLDHNAIKIRQYKTPVTEGRHLAMKHDLKYPFVDWEQQKRDYEEFAFMENMRPDIDDF